MVVLRARVLGRRPIERAALASRVLDDLVSAGRSGPVEAQVIAGGVLIGVGRQIIVGVTATDLDELAGETLQGVTDQTVSRLQLDSMAVRF